MRLAARANSCAKGSAPGSSWAAVSARSIICTRSLRTESAELSVDEGVAHQDGVFALGAGGEKRHRRADQLLDAADIFDGGGRELGPASRAARGFAPPLQRLVNRCDARLVVGIGGKVIQRVAAQPVAHAQL